MKKIPEPVQKYLEIVFLGKDLSRLYQILTPDCHFDGSLYKFTTAKLFNVQDFRQMH